jgi:hypothetical protein
MFDELIIDNTIDLTDITSQETLYDFYQEQTPFMRAWKIRIYGYTRRVF